MSFPWGRDPSRTRSYSVAPLSIVYMPTHMREISFAARVCHCGLMLTQDRAPLHPCIREELD